MHTYIKIHTHAHAHTHIYKFMHMTCTSNLHPPVQYTRINTYIHTYAHYRRRNLLLWHHRFPARVHVEEEIRALFPSNFPQKTRNFLRKYLGTLFLCILCVRVRVHYAKGQLSTWVPEHVACNCVCACVFCMYVVHESVVNACMHTHIIACWCAHACMYTHTHTHTHKHMRRSNRFIMQADSRDSSKMCWFESESVQLRT